MVTKKSRRPNVFVPYAGKLFSILSLGTHALCDLNDLFAAESQFFFFEYFVFCIHMLFPQLLYHAAHSL